MNPSNSSCTIGTLTSVYAIGQLLGPILAGNITSLTHNYTIALIGADSFVLIGACILIFGFQFRKEKQVIPMNRKIFN